MPNNKKPKLSKLQREVLTHEATEPPFTGRWLYNEEEGKYLCAACGNELFDSAHKFESGSGWPSFYDVADTKAVKLTEDNSHGMRRIKVSCGKCGGHLGHVFYGASDQPTSVHFCINSVALDFAPEAKS